MILADSSVLLCIYLLHKKIIHDYLPKFHSNSQSVIAASGGYLFLA